MTPEDILRNLHPQVQSNPEDHPELSEEEGRMLAFVREVAEDKINSDGPPSWSFLVLRYITSSTKEEVLYALFCRFAYDQAKKRILELEGENQQLKREVAGLKLDVERYRLSNAPG